jgi:uncharacterized lipoprotein YajG
MFRRFSAATFIILIYLLTGCAGPSKTIINQESVPHFTAMKILSVTLMNGEVIAFDGNGGQYYARYKNQQRVIVGKTEAGKSMTIALNDVRTARLENDNAVDTRGMFFPTFLIVGLMVVIL